jgi:prepilin-type processing-associated H-X9-DG protein
MYAGDYSDGLPHLWEGPAIWPPVPGFPGAQFYWAKLTNGAYVGKDIDTKANPNLVWHCPEVQQQDMNGIGTFGFNLGGYGPVESTIIRYLWTATGGPLGSRKLAEITRPTQIWLMGDIGSLKNTAAGPVGGPVYGYTTAPTTFPPAAGVLTDDHQPAIRHSKKANVTLVDGHTEAFDLPTMTNNVNNMFGTATGVPPNL